MHRALRWLGPCLALAFLGTAPAADKKKDKVQTKEKIASSGRFVGRVESVEGSSKNFTVIVTFYETDPEKYQALEQYIAQQSLELRGITKPIDRRNRLVQVQAEIAKRQSEMQRKVEKKVELRADDDVKVRTMVLPPNYDDKGRIKKYTKKELAELKGPDKRLKGYLADWDSLHKGQFVQVYLAKPKGKKAPAKPRPKRKKKGEDEKDDEDPFADRPKAVMVIILSDPPEKDK